MQNKETLLLEIKQALNDHYIFKAQELLDYALENYPNEHDVLLLKAEYCLLSWEYPEALSILEQLHANHPEDKDILLKYAIALIKNQNKEASINIFESLTKQYPNDADVFFTYGKELTLVCWEAKELEKAIRALTRALELDPERIAIYPERANAYQNIGNYARALEDLNTYIEHYPDDANIYQKRIALNGFTKSYDAVKADYEFLIAKFPEDTNHLFKYAEFLFKEEEYEKSLEILNQQIALEEGNVWGLMLPITLRGELYLTLKDYEKALADFDFILEHEAENHMVQKLRAQTYLEMGDGIAFLGDVNAALGNNNFYKADLLMMRGNFFIEKEEYDAAEADFNVFLQDESLSFHMKDGYFGLGLIAHKQGDLQKAFEYWTLAKEQYHPEAKEMIETYCGELQHEDIHSKSEKIASEFAEATIENAQNPLLQKLFNKNWKLDLDISLENSPAINQMPKGLLAFFMEAFKNITVFINEEKIFIMNPTVTEDNNDNNIEAYYKIEGTGSDYVNIYAQPLNKKPRRLSLFIDEDYLCITGLMSNISEDNNSMTMYFVASDEASIVIEAPEVVEARMKKIAENFIGDLITTIVDSIDNIGEMFNAQGEPVSDDFPQQEEPKA